MAGIEIEEAIRKRINHSSRFWSLGCSTTACLGSGLAFDHMEEDDSRTNNNSLNQDEKDDEGWLRLGIGGGDHGCATSRDNTLVPIQPVAQRGEFVELDLLPGSSTEPVKPFVPISHTTEFRAPWSTSFSPSLYWQYPSTSSSLSQSEFIWGYNRSDPWNMIIASSSTSRPSVPNLSPPSQVYQGVDLAGPSSDVRIIDAPRRPHSGIWFVLQASQIQAKEPFLPQMPKSYLRIKDGTMTVRLLMKYLVNKLRLNSESEIEIRCRGEELEPDFTLQHVRDNIWRSSSSSRDHPVTLLSHDDYSTTDHVMTLHYARSTAS